MRTTLAMLGLVLAVGGGSAGCGKSEAQEHQGRQTRDAGAEGDDGDAGAESDGDGGAGGAHQATTEGHAGAEAGAPQEGAAPDAQALSPALATMQAANALGEMLRTNALFVHEHRPAYFADFRDQQSPRATLLACADSRFHVGAVDATADGDVFEVRNIGNQVDSAAASVIYGVRHLHTPLLVIVGHVGCGAVRAAMDGHGHLEAPVQAEVTRLATALGPPAERRDSTDPWLDAVVRNVHRQVARAVELFRAEVDGGTLHVVGAVYDFRDDLHRGQGRAVVIDVNGSDVPEASPLLQLVLSSEPVDDAIAGGREPREPPVSP